MKLHLLVVVTTLFASGQFFGTVPAAANDPLVLRAQQKLTSRGYPTEPDGLLGNATKRALREFQQDSGLPVTGELDPRTLNELGVEEPPVELGIDKPSPP
jgi:peptidoglycan hydrolase-like protein with peptidoglycan-binding domain